MADHTPSCTDTAESVFQRKYIASFLFNIVSIKVSNIITSFLLQIYRYSNAAVCVCVQSQRFLWLLTTIKGTCSNDTFVNEALLFIDIFLCLHVEPGREFQAISPRGGACCYGDHAHGKRGV